MLQAIIFDFDGTIADSEPFHFQASQAALASIGIALDFQTHLLECAGVPDLENFRRQCVKHQREADTEQLLQLVNFKIQYFQQLKKQYIKPCLGAVSLIKSAAEQYPLAICSGSHRDEINLVLPHLDEEDLGQFFRHIITVDDVTIGKPDPAGYRLAASKLNILPEYCLAIEDSPTGIIAAKAAGMTVLAVTTSYPREKLTLADHCVSSLAEVTLVDLVQLTSPLTV